MTDWPVMSNEEIRNIRELCEYPVFKAGQEPDGEIAFMDCDTERLYKEIAKAQAKHTGELADAVIVWMCYFAQRQERERIAILIKTELLDRMEKEYVIRQNGGDISSMAVIKMLESRARCVWQALRGDKGE